MIREVHDSRRMSGVGRQAGVACRKHRTLPRSSTLVPETACCLMHVSIILSLIDIAMWHTFFLILGLGLLDLQAQVQSIFNDITT